MKTLLSCAVLLSSQLLFASSECPATLSLRELSKNTLLVVRANEDFYFNKNIKELKFDNFKILLRTAEPFRKSLIKSGTEFPIDVSDESTASYGPRISAKNTDLRYVWVNNNFDFETYTAAQLSIATNGKLEIRCDNGNRVIN